MNSKRANRLFLVIAIIVFLLGVLMILSHIKNGGEITLFGFVLLCLSLIPRIITKLLSRKNSIRDLSKEVRITYFPNILQSVGIAIMIILIALLVVKFKPSLDIVFGREASMLISYLLINGIPLSIAYLIRRKINENHSFELELEPKRIIPLLVIGTLVLLFGIAAPIGSLIPMSDSVYSVFTDLGSQKGFFSFIMMVIAAPIIEELIFRGIILDGLLKRHSPIASILISSLLFGIVHLNPWQFVNAFMIGIFSGWIYFKTKSVLPSILIHLTANLSGFLIKYIVDMDSLTNTSLTDLIGRAINIVLLIIISLVIFSICIYFANKALNKEKLEKGSTQQAVIFNAADTDHKTENI